MKNAVWSIICIKFVQVGVLYSKLGVLYSDLQNIDIFIILELCKMASNLQNFDIK